MIGIMTHAENSESASEVNTISLVNTFFISWARRSRRGSQPQLSLLSGYC